MSGGDPVAGFLGAAILMAYFAMLICLGAHRDPDFWVCRAWRAVREVAWALTHRAPSIMYAPAPADEDIPDACKHPAAGRESVEAVLRLARGAEIVGWLCGTCFESCDAPPLTPAPMRHRVEEITDPDTEEYLGSYCVTCGTGEDVDVSEVTSVDGTIIRRSATCGREIEARLPEVRRSNSLASER